MRSLTTRERLTFLFTLYFSVFLVILSVLFIAIFRLIYLQQMSRDLSHEFVTVTTDNIGMDAKGVFFKKDKNGNTLRTLLFNDGISALFLDKDYQVVRSYGIFENNKALSAERNDIIKAIQDATVANSVKEVTLPWDGVSLTALVTPLKYHSDVVGSMILAKSHDELAQVQDSLVTVLGALGGLSLIVSFMLGFAFTRSALYPLRSIIRSIEKTHLNKLQGKVELSGNPEDEMVVLAHKFNEMLSRLNMMSARQKEFIANASHELRTPLTRAIVSLDSAIMENSSLPQEVREAKEDLWELNRLLEELLILGQVKEGVLPQGEADLGQVTQNIIKRYDNELHLRNITINENIDTFSIPVPADYFAIVLSNIVSNAIKYSPVSSQIYLSTLPGEKALLVRDTGVGMTADELSQLFERFYRGKSVRHTTRGYGLGLSLVKEICDHYKINLEYQSEKGKGTTVKLAFPLESSLPLAK